MHHPELIVMLTYNDQTVPNAKEIFQACQNSKARFWGFKEKSLPLPDMKELFSLMKSQGKTTFLEVVAYTEEEGLEGAKIAAEANCDILMGTVYHDSINNFCKEHNLKYMPFIGKVTQRPSILEGDIEQIIADAKALLTKGIYGFDLLGYRYVGDATELNKKFVSAIDAPVCLAGSINSNKRLDEVKDASPWSFTIGSAFFDKAFGDDFAEQIDTVIDYINK